MTRPKVVLGTVHPDLIDAEFCRCLVRTLTEDPGGYLPFREQVLMARAPAGMLHVARNEVVRSFLAHPLAPRYLLFIDTDMQWTPDQAWALIDTAERQDLPVVGGFVCMQGGADITETIPVMFDYEFRPMEPTAEVQRVFCGGSAFLALRRDALEACAQAHAWPSPWFDYGQRRGKNVTEEVIFAQRLHDLGIPIHVDTRIVVGHRKIHTFRPSVPAFA